MMTENITQIEAVKKIQEALLETMKEMGMVVVKESEWIDAFKKATTFDYIMSQEGKKDFTGFVRDSLMKDEAIIKEVEKVIQDAVFKKTDSLRNAVSDSIGILEKCIHDTSQLYVIEEQEDLNRIARVLGILNDALKDLILDRIDQNYISKLMTLKNFDDRLLKLEGVWDSGQGKTPEKKD